MPPGKESKYMLYYAGENCLSLVGFELYMMASRLAFVVINTIARSPPLHHHLVFLKGLVIQITLFATFPGDDVTWDIEKLSFTWV